MVPPDMVDHEARQAAALANQKIDAHEDRCAERWSEARREMADARGDIRNLKGDIARFLWWIIGIAGAAVSAEFGLILWLLDGRL